ncbi:alpha/beta hydrolase family protein [Cellulomonas sp. NPDC057328]|uniref:alpha/beta hydrolase family protein n=1 Tax=Cellulomonas sp. NPDC057328 TaxID=3346101 RepID=UPI00362794C8
MTVPSAPGTGVDAGAQEEPTVVPTAVGDLRAVVRTPAGAPGPLPGVVLVDGSGDGDVDGWGGWPTWVGDAGAVVLRHDKPGCGGSPGRWTDQTLEDRAHESLAALRVLRAHAGTAGRPVGLYGVSQGAWVAMLAAAAAPDEVGFVVCHSGPGTTPAQQERYRVATALRAAGHDAATVADGLAWLDRRTALLLDGVPVEEVRAEQARHADAPWAGPVLDGYDDPAVLGFVARVLDVDPADVLPRLRCPVLVLLGGADPVVPVPESVRVFAEHLTPDPRHGLAVLPGADHGLFVSRPAPGVPRRDQLAPAYLPTLTAFLADRRAG